MVQGIWHDYHKKNEEKKDLGVVNHHSQQCLYYPGIYESQSFHKKKTTKKNLNGLVKKNVGSLKKMLVRSTGSSFYKVKNYSFFLSKSHPFDKTTKKQTHVFFQRLKTKISVSQS